MKVVAVYFTHPSVQNQIDVARWAEIFYRYSSQVAVRGKEAVLFEIEGSHKIYSEENILARVRVLLRQQNVQASVACAQDAPTALALSACTFSRSLRPTSVSAGRKGDLPLTALHFYATPFYCDEQQEAFIARKIYLLQKLGIENLAGFLALPVQAIVSHLGVEMLSLYEAVRDSRQLPWPFWHPSEKLAETLTVEERENLQGVGSSPEALAFLLKALIDRLVLRCRGRGRRLVRFGLTFVFEKTSRTEGERVFEWTLTLPHLSAREILNMVREKVQFDIAQKPLGDVGVRIEDLRLEAFETAPNVSAQKDIFNPKKEEQNEAWLSLVSRLTDKLGAERVFMAIPQESYCPERAWQRSGAEANITSRVGPMLKLAPRPLRLFKKPIPVGRAWFENVKVDDAPEVLGAEWWKTDVTQDGAIAQPLERVYFHAVHKKTAEKFWVFRSGEGFLFMAVSKVIRPASVSPGAYAELCAKTNYSFLEGASHPEEMVVQAIAQGLHGIAFCDRNGVYGVPKGFRKAKEHPEFKYIVGAELTLRDHPNLILLARDRAAYAWMCRTLTASHADKDKGDAHLYWREFLDYAQAPGAKGWVVIPAADRNRMGESVGLEEKINYSGLKDLFGADVYSPLVRFMDGRDRLRTEAAHKLQKQFGILPIATNDARYHIKKRKVLHDVLIATQENLPLAQCGYKLFSNAERYIKSPQQMAKIYKDMPEALLRTLEIAESCTFNLRELRYRYPSEWIPESHTAQSWLADLVWQGACGRYKVSRPTDLPGTVYRQLEYELKLVGELQFSDYFLTIYDIVKYARSKDILCQGRGSAANSIICYVLGITAIDPIQMELLFERFISAERGEPPDIDVDFEHERREEVIQYIYEKYGRDRAGMVSAVITYRTRSALREVAKAFGLPVGTLSAKKIEREFNFTEPMRTVAQEMKGFPRHLSIHSGGFTLSADPIIDIVPIEPARMEGRTIIQWDKYDLDELGLLKVDILSLGMLSALKKSLDLIGMKMHEIPHDDSATYEMIRNVDTVGTFQIESRAQMSMLGRLQPRTFYDLVIELAIVRPGPIMGEMVHPYLRRRRGEEPVTFPHPDVRDVLEKTLGVPLFQEQVMKLAIKLAKFTPGEADELRRAIGAWRSTGSIEAIGKRLKDGMLASGVTEDFADRFFEQIKGFAHYGFPESHSASFALIAYASCYVKCHYPAEFAMSIVNSQPMGFYANHTLISDANRHGVEVLPVDPNYSDWDCVVIGPSPAKTIRLGLRVVNGLGKNIGEAIVHERQRNGEYKSLLDFLRRTRLRKEILYRIAMAGAFNGLVGASLPSEQSCSPRGILWKLLELDLAVQEKEAVQTSIFQLLQDDAEDPVDGGADFKVLSPLERLQEDFGAYGLTTHGHPMQILKQQWPKLPRATAAEIKQNKSGTTIKAAGLVIIRQKPPTAKGCVFSTLEDETGFLDLILHPKTYERCKEVFMQHCFLIVTGELQRDTKTTSILVKSMQPIFREKSLDKTPLPIEPTTYFYA